MTRLKSFDKTCYLDLRNEYLKKLISSHAIAFDPCDFLLDDKQNDGKSRETYNILKERPALARLRDYLFDDCDKENPTVRREHLRLLLVGPEDMPKSFGSDGSYDTMRQVFVEIIEQIGEIGKSSSGESPEQAREDWETCKKIFNYGQLNRTNKGTPIKTAYWLQQQLRVDTCPFCNRIYTSTLFRGNIRPAFDHFYPKSVYPYLAISLFNLIPICDVCNKAKSDDAEIINDLACNASDTTTSSAIETPEPKSIIYPYDESFDECFETNVPVHVSFRVIPDKGQPWKTLRGQSEQFTIQLHPTNDSGEALEGSSCGILVPVDLDRRFPAALNKHLSNNDSDNCPAAASPTYWTRIKNSIHLLKLEDLYNIHRNEIMRILRNRYQYNRAAIECILTSLLQADFLHGSSETPVSDVQNNTLLLEARNMLYFANLAPDDWGLTPLNKLKADILKQMDMLEMLYFDEDAPSGEAEKHG